MPTTTKTKKNGFAQTLNDTLSALFALGQPGQGSGNPADFGLPSPFDQPPAIPALGPVEAQRTPWDTVGPWDQPLQSAADMMALQFPATPAAAPAPATQPAAAPSRGGSGGGSSGISPVLAQVLAAFGPEPALKARTQPSRPISGPSMPELTAAPETPLTVPGASSGDYLRANASKILPLVGLAALVAAISGKGGKKKAAPAGRTAQAGSLERGQTLRIPREKTGLEVGLGAAAQGVGAYAQYQQAKQAKEQESVDYTNQVRAMVAAGTISPDMGQAMLASKGASSQTPMELGPNAEADLAYKWAATQKAMQPPAPRPQPESAFLKNLADIAADPTRSPEERQAAAAAYQSGKVSGSEAFLTSGQRPWHAPTAGGGSGGAGGITPYQQLLTLRNTGQLIPVPGGLTIDTPGVAELMKQGKAKFAALAPAEQRKWISAMAGVATGPGILSMDMAKGEAFNTSVLDAAMGAAGNMGGTGSASNGPPSKGPQVAATITGNPEWKKTYPTRAEAEAFLMRASGDPNIVQSPEVMAVLDKMYRE